MRVIDNYREARTLWSYAACIQLIGGVIGEFELSLLLTLPLPSPGPNWDSPTLYYDPICLYTKYTNSF